MRKFLPFYAVVALLFAGCVAPSPQPSPGLPSSGPAGSSATASPSLPPSSVPFSEAPGKEDPGPGEDDAGRFAYKCSSLDASPEVQLSSLAEVWAAPNYTRMASCDVSYAGPQPFQPTERELEAITTATGQDAGAEKGLAALLEVQRLCTRVSNEAAADGFGGASKETLVAAAQFCPDSPQGKIIAAWADGSRVGDGEHAVGDRMQPGGYRLVKPAASPGECSWTITASDGGSVVARGGSEAAGQTVDLTSGQNFTSDKCGIWGKMY
ncbi:hypothetical protein ACIPY2_01835 [Paenarthrobacter sp. NPDC089675]|uniref:hypothetical protein n=1 Tax=Paenarthrobacter sp. NPDC089675 TaxID=3364376 RepID=UPI00382E5FEE